MRLLKLFILALGAFIFSSPFSAFAAPDTGMQVSPLTFTYEAKAGDIVNAEINFTNKTTTDLNYSIETEDWVNLSDAGEPVFQAVKDNAEAPTLAKWFSFPNGTEGVLASGQSEKIKFTITIPSTAEPGGHYAGVFMKKNTAISETSNEVAINTRIGVLFLINIPGNETKTGIVKDFNFPKIVWKGPVNFSFKVRNTGTTHYDSKGKIDIASIFNQKMSADFKYTEEIKKYDDTHTVLPNTERLYEATWNNKYPFGRYKVIASAKDGNGKDISSETGIVWAIPLVIVIPALAALILIILLTIYLRKHLQFKK
jgi:hypothetical protein